MPELSPSPHWTDTLAEFLRSEPGLEAVRLDPKTRHVEVATMGAVDRTVLQARLDETLAAITERFGRDMSPPTGPLPAGYTLRQVSGQTELAAPTCATAPQLWRWQRFDWTEPEPPDHGHTHGDDDWRKLAGLAAACGSFGLVAWLVQRFGIGPVWLAPALAVPALIAGGWDPALDAWATLRSRKLDIHFLMLAVAIGAASIGAWHEAVLLLFLFSASEAMEAYAMERTHREVDALLKSAPKHALRLTRDGREEEVPVEQLAVGDRVRVRPGNAYPADGHVEEGSSASDESTLTGESVPVEKGPRDQVFSGTINLWGAVVFEVERLAAESTLQKIIRLIQSAQKLRAPSQRFTDKFGGGYTWAVLCVCTVMFLVWWLGFGLNAFVSGAEASAFYRAMTLLVVISPCALVLSIPSAVLAAIAWGARHGVLFRGGGAIERLADVSVVALDKTGTLTTGDLTVESYESFPVGREQEVQELALALEANSHHPLARAIVKDARARGVRERKVEDFTSITGQGVHGRVGETKVMIGRRELLETGPLADWSGQLPPAPPALAEVWIVSGDLVGRVLLRDELRTSSRAVLDELRRLGMRSVMLTGDRRQAAEEVAAKLGVDETRAGLTPEDKVSAISELKAGGRRVVMVGDGVNDAPSLAAADVSMAMGARGSDAALEQAEVILMEDRIENVLSALRLSRRARRVIRQNLAISLGVVVVMAGAAILGPIPLGLGVVAHEGSTVLVCINSLRLLLARNH